MRVSARPGDPGFKNFAAYRGCKVLLDGVEVKNALTADEEAGWVLFAVADDGHIRLDRTAGEVATLSASGRVQIIPTGVQHAAMQALSDDAQELGIEEEPAPSPNCKPALAALTADPTEGRYRGLGFNGEA